MPATLDPDATGPDETEASAAPTRVPLLARWADGPPEEQAVPVAQVAMLADGDADDAPADGGFRRIAALDLDGAGSEPEQVTQLTLLPPARPGAAAAAPAKRRRRGAAQRGDAPRRRATNPDAGGMSPVDEVDRATAGAATADTAAPSPRSVGTVGAGVTAQPSRSRRTAGSAAPPGSRRRSGRGAAEADADPVAQAKAICLRLLEGRARTRQELGQALRRKGIPDEAAEAVLVRFDEVGLIDDAAFAGQWVRSRHTYSGLGRRAIAQELRRKGVDSDTAGEALAEVDDAAEEARARALVERKLRTRAGTPDEATARRLLGMLARKGYPAGIAYRVVRQAVAEHSAELAEQIPTSDDI